MNCDLNSTKIIKNFAKSWNSPIFRISKVWNPAETATVILVNPEIFKYPIRCRSGGRGRGGGGGGEGCVDIFWNSSIRQCCFHFGYKTLVLDLMVSVFVVETIIHT